MPGTSNSRKYHVVNFVCSTVLTVWRWPSDSTPVQDAAMLHPPPPYTHWVQILFQLLAMQLHSMAGCCTPTPPSFHPHPWLEYCVLLQLHSWAGCCTATPNPTRSKLDTDCWLLAMRFHSRAGCCTATPLSSCFFMSEMTRSLHRPTRHYWVLLLLIEARHSGLAGDGWRLDGPGASYDWVGLVLAIAGCAWC